MRNKDFGDQLEWVAFFITNLVSFGVHFFMTIQFFLIFREFIFVFQRYKPGIRRRRTMFILWLICLSIVLGKTAFYIITPLRYMMYYLIISENACDAIIQLNYVTEFFYAAQNFTMGCLVLFMCYFLSKMESVILN